MFYRQNTEHGIKSIPEKQQEKESSLFRTFSNLPKVTGTQILVKKKNTNFLFYCYTITAILNIYITSLIIFFLKSNNHTFSKNFFVLQ